MGASKLWPVNNTCALCLCVFIMVLGVFLGRSEWMMKKEECCKLPWKCGTLRNWKPFLMRGEISQRRAGVRKTAQREVLPFLKTSFWFWLSDQELKILFGNENVIFDKTPF